MVTDRPDRLLLRRLAIAEGCSDDELARHVRGGDLSRLRRGAYLAGAGALTDEARHRLLVSATTASLRRPAVVSHQSAAVPHCLPLWGVRLDRVHVTRRPPASSEVGRCLRARMARLADHEVEVDGLRSPTRCGRRSIWAAHCRWSRRWSPSMRPCALRSCTGRFSPTERDRWRGREGAESPPGRSTWPTDAARAWARAAAGSCCTGSVWRRRPCS